MKGEICHRIGAVNERLKYLGLEPYSSAHFCQIGTCGGCYLKEIATGVIPDYELK